MNLLTHYSFLLGIFIQISSAAIPYIPNAYEDNYFCKEGCSTDCLSIIHCRNEQEVFINCDKETSGNRPYCNETSLECTESLGMCPYSLQCDENMEEIYIPDLNDCHKYYFCTNGTGIPYTCPSNTRYNPKTTLCTSAMFCCYNFDLQNGLCVDNKNLIIPHPLDNTYYVHCDMKNGPILHFCNGKNYEFHSKRRQCEYVCKNAGRFKDELDEKCKKYYECIEIEDVFIKRYETCPGDTIFVDKPSEGTGQCMKPDENNHC